MITIFYEREPFTAPVRTPDFVVTETEDGLKLARGRDRSGKEWRALMPPATHGLWKTVQNDSRTYYFAGYTGGAGMAPDTWILALSFDERGRPIPFYVTSYSGYDAQGIKDLLDLPAIGPVLLQQTWLETNWNPDARSGYYVTTAYLQRRAYWYRTDGQHGTRAFPLYEKWVTLPNTRPEIVAAPGLAGEQPADYGNDPRSGIRATLLGVDEHGIHTGADLGCELEFIDLVINDSRIGREIEAGYFYASSPGTLLPKIARKRRSITLTGLRRFPKSSTCTASVVWSTAE